MPTLDEGLLAVLGCPQCKGSLTTIVQDEQVKVRCSRCQCEWPVEDGVPQLLHERMTRLSR
ncbi:Trm112 family protein [Corallococcus terminator]